MAIKLIGAKKLPYETGADENLVAKEFLCDTDADFANLPACDPGSSAVSVESGTVMVCNTEGVWSPFANSAGGGDSGGGSSNLKMKFMTMLYYPDYYYSNTPIHYCSYHSGHVADADIIPTKTTEGITPSSPDSNAYLYYIEDEANIFTYIDMEGTGTYEWMDIATFALFWDGFEDWHPAFNGVVTNTDQITEEGYYALIYYVEA